MEVALLQNSLCSILAAFPARQIRRREQFQSLLEMVPVWSFVVSELVYVHNEEHIETSATDHSSSVLWISLAKSRNMK